MWRVRKWLAVRLTEMLYGEDMLWDADDPEQCHYSIEEWAGEVWGPTTGGQETTVTFTRALTLPKRKFRIVSVAHDDSDDIDFQITRIS
jgi:hypothetical protein